MKAAKRDQEATLILWCRDSNSATHIHRNKRVCLRIGMRACMRYEARCAVAWRQGTAIANIIICRRHRWHRDRCGRALRLVARSQHRAPTLAQRGAISLVAHLFICCLLLSLFYLFVGVTAWCCTQQLFAIAVIFLLVVVCIVVAFIAAVIIIIIAGVMFWCRARGVGAFIGAAPPCVTVCYRLPQISVLPLSQTFAVIYVRRR